MVSREDGHKSLLQREKMSNLSSVMSKLNRYVYTMRCGGELRIIGAGTTLNNTARNDTVHVVRFLHTA